MEERLANIERDLNDAKSIMELNRLDVVKTEKYIQCHLPITYVTEINKMIQATFPRRRHKTLLQDYTTKRQNELV